jgi:hypothetical protein
MGLVGAVHQVMAVVSHWYQLAMYPEAVLMDTWDKIQLAACRMY